MRNKKALIAIATPGFITTHTVNSLFALLGNPPCEAEFFVTSGVYVDLQRNMAAKRAIDGKYDYLMFFDNDMIFPANILERLIRSDKDVITTNYVMKLEPAIPMAMYEDRSRVTKIGEGLEKVYAAPTGTMLIKTDALRAMSLIKEVEDNWFSRFKDEKTGEQFGEDIAFGERCRIAGIETYIHWDLTKQIGHVGDKVYSWNDVEAKYK